MFCGGSNQTMVYVAWTDFVIKPEKGRNLVGKGKTEDIFCKFGAVESHFFAFLGQNQVLLN